MHTDLRDPPQATGPEHSGQSAILTILSYYPYYFLLSFGPRFHSKAAYYQRLLVQTTNQGPGKKQIWEF